MIIFDKHFDKDGGALLLLHSDSQALIHVSSGRYVQRLHFITQVRQAAAWR